MALIFQSGLNTILLYVDNFEQWLYLSLQLYFLDIFYSISWSYMSVHILECCFLWMLFLVDSCSNLLFADMFETNEIILGYIFEGLRLRTHIVMLFYLSLVFHLRRLPENVIISRMIYLDLRVSIPFVYLPQFVLLLALLRHHT